MVTNEELFRKMMRFHREVRRKRCRPEEEQNDMPKGCRMRPMPPMPGMPPMEGMPPMPPMPPMEGMPPMPPMPPHCGWHHGKGPHGPGGRHGRGMSREHLLVLIAAHPEGVWQKEIAGEAAINPSSASELIGKLEEAGYLVRETDENDRRAVLLKLTEAGKQRAEEIRAEREEFLAALFSKLSEDEKQTLSTLLDKLLS